MLATKKGHWYLESGCSGHMTGDKDYYLSYEERDGGSVTFGNNDKAKIKDVQRKACMLFFFFL